MDAPEWWTIEDVLNTPQSVTTHLYRGDQKTEEEIVGLLCQCRLLATVSRIQKCMRDGKLMGSDPSDPSPAQLDRSEDGTPPAHSAPSPPSRTTIYTTSDPDIASLYAHRPLPPLPPPRAKAEARADRPPGPDPTTDLTGARRHGVTRPHQRAVGVGGALPWVPDGLAPLEHNQERFAVGLDSDGAGVGTHA
ncbi:hypothetical protein B2J93_376 [Marssonina coronariae]|uniref:Uncharacterized protein n=1 Tax=Diplocarpon coronariae TaxID=2795749 RepID=A0A218Z7X0_9HELO|nr:hypothetical protein B2J93_376 [Marssonina coronariae]